MPAEEKMLCKQVGCAGCICTTCQHQGFDCRCGPITTCDDYDEMMGEQIKLNF